MICTLDKPCGAAAFPDLAFNRDMQLYGLPQRRYCCLAGHSMVLGVPEGLAELVTSTPEKPKRVRKRAKKPRRAVATSTAARVTAGNAAAVAAAMATMDVDDDEMAPLAVDIDPTQLPPGVGLLAVS